MERKFFANDKIGKLLKRLGVVSGAMTLMLIISGEPVTPHIARQPSHNLQQAPQVRITIKIIADSLNTISASVMVPAGTSARDLMQKLFRMEYVDRAKKFVKGIAGFPANPRKREYWALEINGEYAKVGIAEVKLTRPTQIVWRKSRY